MIRIIRCFRKGFGVGYFIILFSLFSCGVSQQQREERIQSWHSNSQFWQYRNEPVLLLGGMSTDNLFNDPELMQKNLTALENAGGNFIHCILSCMREGNVWPYSQKDGRYNLDQFNPEFWNRLESCLREAQKRNIIVQIDLWATPDFYRDGWLKNPFNPRNNSNYTTDSTHLVMEWSQNPGENVQPFFVSIPSKNNDTVLLSYQEKFMHKVLDVALPFPNVLYCLDTETCAPVEWAAYWADFLRRLAEKHGFPIQLTEMWDQKDIQHDIHKRTYDRPDLFSFVDISPNTWQSGEIHYENARWMRETISESNAGSRPINNAKVHGINNPGETCNPALNVDRWWQNLFAGCASSCFDCPDSGLGLSEPALKAIRSARAFFKEYDFFHAVPRQDLIGEREENEAFCLMVPYDKFAVYFPQGGEVALKIVDSKTYRVRWFDPQSAQYVSSNEITVNTEPKSISLKSPSADRSWLVSVQ